MNLAGKKLLILGGNAISIDIVEAAHSLGVYTIVADWYDAKRSPAKLIADEFWDVSIFDTELLVQMIKDNNVGGIITGFTDSYLLQYQLLCELSGLPCYASKEVFETTLDKAKFKQLCKDNGVPVIPEYDPMTFDPKSISDRNKIIIKPVDNRGSRGVVLCCSPDDYQTSLEYALSFSEKKQVLIEKYMEMDSFSVSYTFQDGVASLSTTDDRYVHKALTGGAVTQCSLYPSKYMDTYIDMFDSKVRRMYEGAGLKNGVVAVQFFTDGKMFYVMEMAHRLSGGKHYTYTKMENGISVLDQMIHFAITGSMADYSLAEKDNPRFKHTYCHLFILGKEAKIFRFKGLHYLEALPEVFSLSKYKNVGDMIGPDGTSGQKVIDLHLKDDNYSHLKTVIKGIEENIRIIGENGEDLTISFNIDIL